MQVTTRTRYDTMGRPTIIDYLAYGTNTSIQPSRYFWYDVASDGFYPSGNAKGLLAEAHLMTGDTKDSGTRFTYDIMGRITGTYQCVPGWCSVSYARGMYRAYGYDLAGNNTTESWTIGWIANSPQPAVTMTRTYTVAGELASMYGGLGDSSAPNSPSFYQVALLH